MPTIGFLGAGNMGASMLEGLLSGGTRPDQLHVFDKHESKISPFSKKKVHTHHSVKTLAPACDIIVIAVKPQGMLAALKELCQYIAHKPLIISVAAGISTAYMTKILGKDCAIVRAMPNTPAQIKAAAIGLFANDHVSTEQKQSSEAICNSIGKSVWLDTEAALDPVTALSGSGPAFVFYFMECLVDAATELGLDYHVAHELCTQTLLGSALLAQQNHDLGKLREQVTSKGGTTAAGLSQLTSSEFKSIIKTTLVAATQRAKELNVPINEE